MTAAATEQQLWKGVGMQGWSATSACRDCNHSAATRSARMRRAAMARQQRPVAAGHSWYQSLWDLRPILTCLPVSARPAPASPRSLLT